MKTLYIMTSGAFHRPIDTPAGKAGWVGEITFYRNNLDPRIVNRPDITENFDTEDDAKRFVSKTLHALYNQDEFRVRGYARRSYFTQLPE